MTDRELQSTTEHTQKTLPLQHSTMVLGSLQTPTLVDHSLISFNLQVPLNYHESLVC